MKDAKSLEKIVRSQFEILEKLMGPRSYKKVKEEEALSELSRVYAKSRYLPLLSLTDLKGSFSTLKSFEIDWVLKNFGETPLQWLNGLGLKVSWKGPWECMRSINLLFFSTCALIYTSQELATLRDKQFGRRKFKLYPFCGLLRKVSDFNLFLTVDRWQLLSVEELFTTDLLNPKDIKGVLQRRLKSERERAATIARAFALTYLLRYKWNLKQVLYASNKSVRLTFPKNYVSTYIGTVTSVLLDLIKSKRLPIEGALDLGTVYNEILKNYFNMVETIINEVEKGMGFESVEELEEVNEFMEALDELSERLHPFVAPALSKYSFKRLDLIKNDVIDILLTIGFYDSRYYAHTGDHFSSIGDYDLIYLVEKGGLRSSR